MDEGEVRDSIRKKRSVCMVDLTINELILSGLCCFIVQGAVHIIIQVPDIEGKITMIS